MYIRNKHSNKRRYKLVPRTKAWDLNPDLEVGLPLLKVCLSLTVFEADPAAYCRNWAHRDVTQTLPWNLRSESRKINNHLAKWTNKSQVYYKQQYTTLRAGRGEQQPVPTFTDVTPDLEDNYTTACADILANSPWKPTITAHDNISPEGPTPIESLKMSTHMSLKNKLYLFPTLLFTKYDQFGCIATACLAPFLCAVLQ
jgi:hypothetical protein